MQEQQNLSFNMLSELGAKKADGLVLFSKV